MMLSFFLCFLFVVVNGQQYECENEYIPASYKGKLRVPTDCKLTTPSYKCPPSWKSGVPKGSSTSPPLIYSPFISCHEGFTKCGYVPIKPASGEVLGHSGVTIGSGVDLGSMSSASLSLVSVSRPVVTKLQLYFGLKRNFAACAAIERPLQLSSDEAEQLTDAVKQHTVIELSKAYNKDRVVGALSFGGIPRGIRTAIASVWYQFGPQDAYPKFWAHVVKNDWKGAVKELRHFYDDESRQQPGDLRRRNDEADIIEATFVECHRSIDAVILVDESGSVSLQSFKESLEFVKQIITAFPDEKLKGNNGTKFGLATFSNGYRDRFYLNSYTSQSEYVAAIDRVIKISGGTNLGHALTQTLASQFTELRGLRHNVPHVLIVLTDGKSFDEVTTPAKQVRDQNIAIYAIGIGDYNILQLQDVVTPLYVDSHIFTLTNYDELETLISTISAATCNEPQRMSLENTVTATAAKDDYKYFAYSILKLSNLKFTVNAVLGETVVYASRSNPHPYKYDHDIKFESSGQKEKVIVIAAVERQSTRSKRDLSNNTEQAIYVSVQATTDLASFTIVGNTCDPVNCTEGTNEIQKQTNSVAQPIGSRMSSLSFIMIITIFFVLFLL